MAAATESKKGRVRILQLGLAALIPKLLPFPLQEIDVVARSDGAGVVVGFLIEHRKLRLQQLRQRLGRGLAPQVIELSLAADGLLGGANVTSIGLMDAVDREPAEPGVERHRPVL